MTTDGKKNDEQQLSRRQLLKTSVGLIGAGLAIGDGPVFGLEQPAGASADWQLHPPGGVQNTPVARPSRALRP